MNMLEGIPIIEDDMCEYKSPARVHEKKEWMTESYHKRIQNKWNKRYGYKLIPAMYMTSYGIVCHPDMVMALRSGLSTQTLGYSDG